MNSLMKEIENFRNQIAEGRNTIENLLQGREQTVRQL